MEKVFKRSLVGRRADKYQDLNQNLISCSNAIYSSSDCFAELPTDIKSFLGIKKAG